MEFQLKLRLDSTAGFYSVGLAELRQAREALGEDITEVKWERLPGGNESWPTVLVLTEEEAAEFPKAFEHRTEFTVACNWRYIEEHFKWLRSKDEDKPGLAINALSKQSFLAAWGKAGCPDKMPPLPPKPTKEELKKRREGFRLLRPFYVRSTEAAE